MMYVIAIVIIIVIVDLRRMTYITYDFASLVRCVLTCGRCVPSLVVGGCARECAFAAREQELPFDHVY